MRNLVAKLPKKDAALIARVEAAYWAALNEAASPADGETRLRRLVTDLERSYPNAAACLAEDLPAICVYLAYPPRLRERLRSTNLLERSPEEVKRRTNVIGRFPGETSCLSLCWAVLDLFIISARGLGLTAREHSQLEAEKTRLVEFGRLAASNRASRGLGKPETFDFQGFTHISSKTRTGRFAVKRITFGKLMRAKLREVKAELMRRLNQPIPKVGRWLESVVRGHLAYYAVPGNLDAARSFCDEVKRHWLRTLRSRSQRTGTVTGTSNWCPSSTSGHRVCTGRRAPTAVS